MECAKIWKVINVVGFKVVSHCFGRDHPFVSIVSYKQTIHKNDLTDEIIWEGPPH